MSLTQTDLQQIEAIFDKKLGTTVRQEVEGAIESKIRPVVRQEIQTAFGSLGGEIKALRNDIKELYNMIDDLRGTSITDKALRKLTVEDQLLKIHAELMAAAKQAGVVLPRS